MGKESGVDQFVAMHTERRLFPFTWEEMAKTQIELIDLLTSCKDLNLYLKAREAFIRRVAKHMIQAPTYDKMLELHQRYQIVYPNNPNPAYWGKITWEHERQHQKAWQEVGVAAQIGLEMYDHADGFIYAGICLETCADIGKVFKSDAYKFMHAYGKVLLAPSLRGFDYEHETNLAKKLLAASGVSI